MHQRTEFPPRPRPLLGVFLARSFRANLCAKILDVSGFDSSSILSLKGGIIVSIAGCTFTEVARLVTSSYTNLLFAVCVLMVSFLYVFYSPSLSAPIIIIIIIIITMIIIYCAHLLTPPRSGHSTYSYIYIYIYI